MQELVNVNSQHIQNRGPWIYFGGPGYISGALDIFHLSYMIMTFDKCKCYTHYFYFWMFDVPTRFLFVYYLFVCLLFVRVCDILISLCVCICRSVRTFSINIDLNIYWNLPPIKKAAPPWDLTKKLTNFMR